MSLLSRALEYIKTTEVLTYLLNPLRVLEHIRLLHLVLFSAVFSIDNQEIPIESLYYRTAWWCLRVSVCDWLLNVTCNDILVIYVTAHGMTFTTLGKDKARMTSLGWIQSGTEKATKGRLLQRTSSDQKATTTNRMHSNDLITRKKCCFWFRPEEKKTEIWPRPLTKIPIPLPNEGQETTQRR